MQELLITYLGISASIALLLTGPDEDNFEFKHVIATVFGWPVVALALACMVGPSVWAVAQRWASERPASARAHPVD
jgi:hypothetical protein